MITDREVYGVLNYHWQTTNKIREKIAEKRNKRRYQINVGTIRLSLNRLERYGFAESREREPTKKEKERRNYKVLEYKKISGKEPDYDKLNILENLVLVPA